MESIGASCSTGNVGVAQLMFTQLITSLVNSYCELRPSFPPDQSERAMRGDETYDFIVVGAGSAGSAVAARLSEVDGWKVLLIEAGADPPLESNIPALMPTLIGSAYDWRFEAESSEKACLGTKGGRCRWPKGKMLGGSSSMNGMFYVRGLASDYDRWAELGNGGWDYEHVLPYFKKLERVAASTDWSPQRHGYEGAVDVQPFPPVELTDFGRVERMFEDAARQLGLRPQPDFATTMRSGSISLWGTLRNGTRASAAKAYLVPAAGRANLIVAKETLVTGLLMDGGNNSVRGVRVSKNGRLADVVCTKEVILSAGAINSPKILMLSGIGPRQHLDQHGIRTVADLKVGHNLQDHILLVNLLVKTNTPQPPAPAQHDALYRYLTRRTELASLQAAMLFVDTTAATNGTGAGAGADADAAAADLPDIQYHIFNQAHLPRPSLFDTMGLKEEATRWLDDLRGSSDVVAVMPTLLRPKSAGRVLLRGADFGQPPKLVSGYLEHPDDVRTLVRGIRYLEQRLMRTEALANATLLWAPAAQCDRLEAGSDRRYECYVRHFCHTVYHVAGSCKMGPASDEHAVVDPRLRVHRVRGLRVADSSVMPSIVSGNTNVPTIMIGEKAADMIKQDWLNKDESPTTPIITV